LKYSNARRIRPVTLPGYTGAAKPRGESIMTGELIVAGLVAAFAVVAYFERKSLRADVVAAEAKVVSAGEKFILALRSKESQVRAKIWTDVSKVIVEAKAEAEKIEADVKADVSKAEGSVKALVAKIEADVKKAI